MLVAAPGAALRRVGRADEIDEAIATVDLERELRDRPDALFFDGLQENPAGGLRTRRPFMEIEPNGMPAEIGLPRTATARGLA